VLEDSPIGVAAAVAAACPCVMVPSMPMVDEAVRQQARLVLADLAQVADFIAVELRHSV
jgi:beta-phosphoglucomutase-like phosphatase (HAD superfamily)